MKKKMKSETKEALLKNPTDLEDCVEGKEVVLLFDNGEEYTGIFEGFDGDDTIMLKSKESEQRIGLPYNRLKVYLESK